MPSFNLTAASGAASLTDAVPINDGISVNVSGTFVGTVQFQRATTPGGTFTPIAADNFGTLLQFTGASGDVALQRVPNEGAAVVRAVMTAYTSGTAAVRIGQ
jgi:hypothetical protein